MHKVALYYTCNTHDVNIEMVCRRQLVSAKGDCQLVSVSREPIDFGDWNVVIDAPRSPLTMHIQILAGLEKIDADVVFLCESDMLYHQDHFDFIPQEQDFYYNTNVWRVRYKDGLAVWTDNLQQVSGCCATRELLLEFYRRRVVQIMIDGFNRHYEPGPKTGSYRTENRQSEFPNLDIRHDKTLTRSKWAPSEFRNKRYAKGWKESFMIAGWGNTQKIMESIHDRASLQKLSMVGRST